MDLGHLVAFAAGIVVGGFAMLAAIMRSYDAAGR